MQSLALKPAVLTTDLTLAPIYELVDDDRKRATLRAALDDLLAGNLRNLTLVTPVSVEVTPGHPSQGD